MEIYIKDGSVDPDQNIVLWEVSWGDGTPDSVLNSPPTVPGFILNHTYATTGPYTITMTTTDADGLTDSASRVVDQTPGNDPPVPVIRIGTETGGNNGTTCVPVDVDAVGSTDDGTIESYRWSWGDGTPDTEIQCRGGGCTGAATHQYSVSGAYIISLEVIDDGGLEVGAARQHVIALAADPEPVISIDRNGTLLLSTLVIADESTHPDGTIVEYVWDWGDGTDNTVESTPNGETPTQQSHQYATIGSKEITLTVTDSCGNSAQATAIAEVFEVVPEIVVTPTPGSPDNRIVDDLIIDFDGDDSVATGGVLIIEYNWDWGDTNTDQQLTPGGTPPPTIQHTYASEGTYTVTLSVLTDAAVTGETEVTIKLISTPVADFDVCDNPTCT